ncbi:MAG: M1 family metallopeptidase [Opitutaceae bacterium]|nr:M1 family metallopeptidase [Verrucomicrobiales bacterium]
MNTRALSVAVLMLILPATRAVEGLQEEVYCQKVQAGFAPVDSAVYRKYAPDRDVDILHLALDVTPDFRRHSVAGRAVVTFKPIARPLREFRLDAVDLQVKSVEATAAVEAWQATGQQLVVTFASPVETGREVKVTVDYSAEPQKGLYFRTTEMGYLPGEDQIWTQGEAIEARHWYPCFDSPNEKSTTEITCHVPEGMTVLSNGRKLSENRDPTTGLVTVRWLQDKPHANYLVSLIAGHFQKVEDRHRDVPMAFYTSPSDIKEAPNSFEDTRDIMVFFEKEIGVPFPWARYDQVTVRDFVAGGMENTSMTTLTDKTLFTRETENLRRSQGLVAHELAHQWFGDLVTCKDWSHLWLNEGFATYYDLLYDGHKNGRDMMLYRLHGSRKTITEIIAPPRPVVFNKFDNPMEQFGYLAYQKGSWVLHMLRSQLGEELYRRCIKAYLERHQYGNVVTEDLNSVVEELSGRSFDPFFDQWVYRSHHPELEIAWSWEQTTKLVKISVRQTQKLSDDVSLFQFPLKLRFMSRSGAVDREVLVKEKEEDFYLPLVEAPEIVRVDPGLELLARINFPVSAGMLRAQLAEKSDAMGRVLAAEQLGRRKDLESVAVLKTALNQDSFFGVRVEAAKALRAIHSDAAFEALLDSLEQPDARVRQQVASSLGAFYRKETFDAVLTAARKEKNPEIVASYLKSLAMSDRSDVAEYLVGLLDSKSYRNSLMDSAIAAMRVSESPQYLDPLKAALQRHEKELTSSALIRGINTLAYLARNEDKKEPVRRLVMGYVNDPRRTVQLGAITSLGVLGDVEAVPVLETFAAAAKESPERDAAEKALGALRASQKPSENLREVRNEILELQKLNRDLRQELNTVKKKIDAAPPLPNKSGNPSRPKSAGPKSVR